MYPTAPPWKRGRPGTATGWKRASSSRRARSGLPGGRRWGLPFPPRGVTPVPPAPERDPVPPRRDHHQRVRSQEGIARPLFSPLHRLQEEGVGSRAEPQEGGEGRVEVSGRLGVDGDQGAPLSEEPELLERRREGRDVEHGGLHRGVRRPLQASASSFFWSWLFGTAPMTWSRTLPPLTKRVVGIEGSAQS